MRDFNNMKIAILIFLVFLYAGSEQILAQSPNSVNRNVLAARKDSNIIRVSQGALVSEYNIHDERQLQQLLIRVKNFPQIKAVLDKMLRNGSLPDALNGPLKNMITISSVKGYFDIGSMVSLLIGYQNENTSLRAQIEALTRTTTDPQLEQLLKEGDEKLKNFDNDGYQRIFREFLSKEIPIADNANKNVAFVAYLSARNYSNNFKYDSALFQINLSLKYDPANAKYEYLRGEILKDIYQFDESLASFRRVLSMGIADSLRSDGYSMIGNLYDGKGLYDSSMIYFKIAFSIGKKIFPVDKIRESVLYSNIGTAYIRHYQYDSGIAYFDSCLLLEERTDTGGVSLPITLNNLAYAYFFKGDNDKALKYYRRSISILEKGSAAGTPELGVAYNNIGGVFGKIKKYDSALYYYRRDSVIETKYFGADDPYVAGVCSNIGWVFMEHGRYHEAEYYFGKTLAVFYKRLGANNISTAIAFANLAQADKALEEYDIALSFSLKAIEIRKSLHEKDNEGMGRNFVLAGSIYIQQSNYDSALFYLIKGVSILEKALPRYDPFTAEVYDMIGKAYYFKAVADSSMEFYRKSIQIREKVLGKSNPTTAISYNNIAALYLKMRDYGHALSYFHLNLAICKTAPGDNSEDLATAYNSLGATHYRQGTFDSALFYYDHALHIRQHNGDPGNKDISTVYEELGLVKIARGEIDTALSYLEKSKFRGMPYRKRAAYLGIEGMNLAERQHFEAATRFFYLGLVILDAIDSTGKDPLRVSFYQGLGIAYCSIGNKEKAYSFFEKALSLESTLNDDKEALEEIKRIYQRCRDK